MDGNYRDANRVVSIAASEQATTKEIYKGEIKKWNKIYKITIVAPTASSVLSKQTLLLLWLISTQDNYVAHWYLALMVERADNM